MWISSHCHTVWQTVDDAVKSEKKKRIVKKKMKKKRRNKMYVNRKKIKWINEWDKEASPITDNTIRISNCMQKMGLFSSSTVTELI